ncbi:MAG: DUF962 domain-containing protein [Rhodobacterales bacterium]
MTRKIDTLLAEYGESHQNPTNKLVHWICVPVIVWSLMALIWSIPVPAVFRPVPNLTWLTPILLAAILYYIVVSWRLAVGVLVCLIICLCLIVYYQASFTLPLWQVALSFLER